MKSTVGSRVAAVVTAVLLSVSMALSPVTVGLSALSSSVAFADPAENVDIVAYGVRWRLDTYGNLVIGDDQDFATWSTNAIPDAISKSSIRTISIGAAGVKAPSDMKYAFANLTSLEMVNLEGLDTSETTYIGGLFSGCTNLYAADISSLDLSAVEQRMISEGRLALNYDASDYMSWSCWHALHGDSSDWLDEFGQGVFGSYGRFWSSMSHGEPIAFSNDGTLPADWVNDTVYGSGNNGGYGRHGRVGLLWDEDVHLLMSSAGNSSSPGIMSAVFNNCSSMRLLKVGEGFRQDTFYLDPDDLTLKKIYGNVMGSNAGEWINVTKSGAESFDPNEFRLIEYCDWNPKAAYGYDEEDGYFKYVGQYLKAHVKFAYFTEPGTYARYDSSASYPLKNVPSVGSYGGSSNAPARIAELGETVFSLGLGNSSDGATNSGSGQMSLRMIAEDTIEHGGTSFDPSNPDDDNDGLGDNLAFTVPSVVNYVVKADGQLLGPSEGVAYIENKSAFATHVSSMDVDPETDFNFVADASASNAANSVDFQLGPAADMLQASEYLNKKDVNDATKWNMAAVGTKDASKVLLKSEGDVSNIAKDITSSTQFGTVKWYVTPGEVS